MKAAIKYHPGIATFGHRRSRFLSRLCVCFRRQTDRQYGAVSGAEVRLRHIERCEEERKLRSIRFLGRLDGSFRCRLKFC
jgi:hypothetical protein